MSGISTKLLQAAAGREAVSFWIALLGGTGTDYGNAVAIDSADNIIVAGFTTSDGAGSNDLLIAKYNSAGALQWDRTLGGTGNDYGNAVAIDSANNIIVTGFTTSDGAGSNDLLIAKYNSAGALQWDRTLGGTGNDVGMAVAIDSANNIIVTGHTTSDGAGGLDVLIAKYNSAGALQWVRTLGGTGTDYGRAVAIDSANNIIVTGVTTSDGAGSNDLLIAKYNSAGALQWDRTLGEWNIDVGNAVAIDSANNIIVTGYTASDGAGSNDFLIAKYNSAGALQWVRTLGGTGADVGMAVAIDSANNIIVTGHTASDGAGGADVLIAKYNSAGALQWVRTLGGTGTDYGNAVAIDSADNIIVAGYTASDGAGGADLLIAKLPPNGSGTGTYGSFTYEAAVLTDAPAVLTDALAVLTDAPAVLTDVVAVLTDAPAVLTEELIDITL
jgi:uncharacterized delta-60 repeat protein